MRTERTERTWFSRLLRHPARKWSGSILTTPEPVQGSYQDDSHLRTTEPWTLLMSLKHISIITRTSGLMSRCTMPLEWMKLMADTSFLVMQLASFSVKCFLRRMRSSSSPPVNSSITMYTWSWCQTQTTLYCLPLYRQQESCSRLGTVKNFSGQEIFSNFKTFSGHKTMQTQSAIKIIEKYSSYPKPVIKCAVCFVWQ